MTEIIYTDTFGNTADERIDYLSQRTPTPQVVEKVETLIETFE